DHILEVYKKLVNTSVERVAQAIEEKKIEPSKSSNTGSLSGSAWATIEQCARELVERLSPKIERPDKEQAEKYIPSGIKLPRTKFLAQLTLKDLIKERRMIEKEEKLSLYHQFYNETSAIIQHLSGVLENYFLKNRKPRYEGYFYSGQKPDLRKAMNQSRKLQEKIPLERKDMEIFLRRRLPTEREHYIALVLDESGSMAEPKRSTALKGLLIFMEALTNLDIDHAIVGFADTALLHKSFGDFSNQAQRANLFEEISMYIPSGMTADADALALTTELLEKQPEETMKLIIMITDGEGNINNTGKSFEELQEEARAKGIEVIGIGLGGYITQVGKRYKTSVQIEKIEDLPRTLATVLQEKIEGDYFE
ncbi:MAG: VWA domain-containing protein, partial [Candidatus Desulfofervidaceae bacterium]|nr:VWA domain-containing protein [Candidatus Desulfofervidaceae bacterium]